IHLESSKWTIFHSIFKSFLYGWNKLLRNSSSFNFINKLNSFFLKVFIYWPHLKYDVSKFTSTSSLFFICFSMLCCFSYCLFILYSWLSFVYFYFKLSL